MLKKLASRLTPSWFLHFSSCHGAPAAILNRRVRNTPIAMILLMFRLELQARSHTYILSDLLPEDLGHAKHFSRRLQTPMQHSDLVPSAPPPSPSTPNRSEACSKVLVPNLLDLTEFGVCRSQTQLPLAMEDGDNLYEERMLHDPSEPCTHSRPAEQKNGSQLVEERHSDDGMETSEENRDESDDDMEELMEVTSTASGRPSGYVTETK
ncbi:hypothetical protein IW261DRAFT_220879 [Armillaria novae-zelandiae]|uniref:Uncharacterized protein n=1 Tax=Armillaria novae-zelandiae TaxID=153914 RepID=A0AA39U6A0_9AGAR|nr:hypothetical protein IW261DRAFT_220879 [Armillaria novae-zelandiae]